MSASATSLETPLATIPPGSRVRITAYAGGRMLRARLSALGLNIGREVDIIQNNRGVIIVGVNGGRVALGRGVSQKILVLPLTAPSGPQAPEETALPPET